MNNKYRDLALKFLKKIIALNCRAVFFLVKKVKKKPEEFFMNSVCASIENKEYDISYRLRPNRYDVIPIINFDSQSSFAIVLQGPIRKQNNFTLNTVRFYKKMYHSAIIIVSTWNDEDARIIKQIRKSGVIVIENEKPVSGGHLNVNYQIISSQKGIEEAINLGAKYICKTRTDQRICKAYSFDYLINLMNMYPANNQNIQDKRLVCMSMHYGNMFYPYLISDFFYFGTSKEMKRLFSLDLDNRENFSMDPDASKREYAISLYAPETYIMYNYLAKLGHDCRFSVKDYWRAVKDYLICVDRKMLDLFWPKYERKYEENAFTGDFFLDDDFRKLKTMNFDFVNWVNLFYGSLKYDSKFEKFADQKFQ